MFDPAAGPRIFGNPLGVDYAESLVAGLEARLAGAAPEDWARVEIWVNTERMKRRLAEVFDRGPARLLPRVRILTELADHPAAGDIPAAAPPIRRRLEIARFVERLLDAQPDLAPKSALYDLSDSLARLMDEMQGEGVSAADLAALDVTDLSGHWARAQQFLGIVAPLLSDGAEAPGREARQRQVVETLAARWAEAPPQHPVLVAGSTGSRGATALFMQAVARLPQGAVILPGYDFGMPEHVWDALDDQMTAEDHPQYRFKRLMDLIGFAPEDVARWSGLDPANPARNALVSLSLRPAPVTDQWLAEGPRLGDLAGATEGLTLIEAASPRAEAETIALGMRAALEEGKRVALVSPDRVLTRQVTAALDRWGIKPDDSAGVPLPLAPPGRLLRHVAELGAEPLTVEALLVLLKHPLTHAGGERGAHLLRTRKLELHLRRHGPAFPDGESLRTWAGAKAEDAGWIDWLAGIVDRLAPGAERPLDEHLAHQLALTEALVAGSIAGAVPDELWAQAAGREARRIVDALAAAADAGGEMEGAEYAMLFGSVLSDGVVRDRDAGDPRVLIWGTLEARVQNADLTILGGLNDGTWPEAPPPDPWLNRRMRKEAGLLLPERQVGLSAHDYQQSVAGGEVWITRAKRSTEAETVPSRWVNRLTNLLSGLGEEGAAALAGMRARGDRWLAMAERLALPEAEVPRAARPAPRPPVEARPRQLSVTQVKTLIRDPYAIYAQKVLRLNELDPLVPSADAPLRGIILHKVMERILREDRQPDERARLMRIAQEEFDAQCPWPTIRAFWLARFEGIVDGFLEAERDRQARAEEHVIEQRGEIEVAPTGVTLTCRADRIDRDGAGRALIYDYKSGTPPSGPQQESFDKQLLLEAAMVQLGAFPALGRAEVEGAWFLGIGSALKEVAAPLDKQTPDEVWTQFASLLAGWQQRERGYTARRALFSTRDRSPFDHLSRFGEWEATDDPSPEDVG